MILPKITSKTNLVINLVGFFAALLVMWFGVFKLHLYDAIGTKQQVSKIILAIDWIIIAFNGLTILHIVRTQRKTAQYKNLSLPVKLSGAVAATLVVFGILAVAATVIFYILLALAWSQWSF